MRLIVIGDLHGCWQELQDLLARLSISDGDVVASVGDFLTKGPDPERCVELWKERGWHAVVGNNDRSVLHVIRGELEGVKESIAEDACRLEERAELVEYLDSLPRVLDYPELDCAVVHGGILPHSTFADGIDPDGLLTLREVVRAGEEWRAAEEDDPEETRQFWADAWSGDRFVVYGHTPRREPMWHSRAIGIDTGCVYGWSLTAAVRSPEGEWSTTSVPARREWAER